MARLLGYCFLACLLLITGCETVKPPTSGDPQHYSQIQKLRRWQAEGKLSVKVDKERHNASFNWKQSKKNYVIHLFGPFGWGSTWLRSTRHGVSLENAKHGRRHAKTPEELMLNTAGWNAPISALQYWVRGTPSPELKIENVEEDEKGFITQLSQDGWQVSFQKPKTAKGWRLPGKIVATRDNVRVLVVVKKWTL